MRVRIFVVAALTVSFVAGCGGSEETSDQPDAGAIGLTGWLPTDAPAYDAVDLAALKASLDLPPDADPMGEEISSWTAGTWAGMFLSFPSRATIRALDLPAATEVADRLSQKKVEPVTAMRTSADTGEIRSALFDLGFVDRDGILEGPDGERATGHEEFACRETIVNGETVDPCPKIQHGALAVRFEGDVVLVSPDAKLLAAAPSSPGSPPLEVLSHLDGDAVLAMGYPYGCVTENGIATSPDGSGEMVAIYDGSPEDIEVSPDPGADNGVSEPTFDGDVVTVELGLPEPMPPRFFQADKFAAIFCD